MNEIKVTYDNDGFRYWLHFRDVEFSVSTLFKPTSTIILSPEQAEVLQEQLSNARQEAEYQKIVEVKNDKNNFN